MAANTRQGKPRKDGGQFQSSNPNQARRGGGPSGGAWRGSQNNPSIMNYGSNARTPQTHSTPPPSNSNATSANGPAAQAKDSNYSSPSTANATAATTASANGSATNLPPASYIGSLIVVTTKTGSRHEGTLVANEHVTHPGISLKDAKDLVNPGAPLAPALFIPVPQLQHWSSAPSANAVNTNGSAVLDSFRTDTDISANGVIRKERELQAWNPDSITDATHSLSLNEGSLSHQNGTWDQFAANEKLFGVTTNFDEELYTTKLDRNAADFKEKERKAQQIADSITGAVSSNPHVREERGLDGGNMNEEEKYGAVVRGPNAYVPPGARKAADTNGAQLPKSVSQSNVPQVSVNGPDGSSVAASVPASTSNPSATGTPSTTAKPDDGGVIASFREFVTTEKQKLVQKKQAMAKSEKDKKFADLIQFSSSFKLNKPIPADLVSILTKDEEKAKALVAKTQKDAEDNKARAIGTPITSITAVNGSAARPAPTPAQPTKPPVHTQTTVPSFRASVIQPIPPFKGGPTKTVGNATKSTATSASMTKSASSTKSETPTESSAQVTKKSLAAMQIPKIPPFDPSKRRTAGDPKTSGPVSAGPSSSGHGANAGSPPNFRLNVNASSFRPNPNASSFKPGPPSTSGPTPSPKTKPGETSQPPNPFFGNKLVKKTGPVHVKDDFNPFKIGKVGDASSLANQWSFSGKRFQSLFPAPPQPQHAPQPPPVGPSTTFEEDPSVAAANQQAVAAQQVRVTAPYPMMYSYPYPYNQPQPHMMVAPGAPPPTGYMPPQFMQPMPFQPQMPPNAAPGMYPPPPMGGMPPMAPGYMPPPPPGATAYPPANGPRGSISPSPMPPHQLPYGYHQSPQMAHAHAVPYPMMMPPPGGPPHGYESQPPIPGPMGNGH